MLLLKNIPKILFHLLVGFGFLVFFLFACKDPNNDQDVIPPADPFKNYSRVSMANLWLSTMTDYYSFEHFHIDYYIYLITTGVRYNIQKAKFDLDFGLHGSSPFYESGYKLDIKAAVNTDWPEFIVVGEIFNESPIPYSNPFIITSDDYGEMKIYNWNSRNNGFAGIVMRHGYDLYPVLLARDETGTIGTNYVLNKYSLVFLDYKLDSASEANLTFDSCFIDYFDMKNETTFRFAGMKIDGITGNIVIKSHMFYAETDLEGNVLTESNLGEINSGSTEINKVYYENVEPLNIYHWNFKKNNVLNLEKYSNTGVKEYSREIELFTDHPGIEAVCKVEKSVNHNDCLIYGYFQQNMDPAPPIFKGNFFIKTDDEGNEAIRVIWNEDVEGHYGSSSHIIDLGNEQYFFLYNFHFDNGFNYFTIERLDLGGRSLSKNEK